MTNEEAKTKFKDMLMAESERIPTHYDAEVDVDIYDDTVRIEEILELNKIVCGALEKADKYRQHDLKMCGITKSLQKLPPLNSLILSSYTS